MFSVLFVSDVAMTSLSHSVNVLFCTTNNTPCLYGRKMTEIIPQIQESQWNLSMTMSLLSVPHSSKQNLQKNKCKAQQPI